nr:hypothetical protein [Tanacetum cinerariifolium]
MANVNVNAPAGQAPTMAPPIRNDDQILPHIRWVPIGKSNCYLDVEKSQRNPIYKIAVDILKCQLDEQRFDLTKDTLKDALQITPVNNNQAFTSPPSSDALINFVNELGYPKLVRHLSNVEEFTQSIHTFIDDKRNLAQLTHGKKKATLIVILSIRFTKLIIYHLQRKHKFHPRPDSLLHLPNEEPVLRYLKFSAKGTKREVFEMLIPGSLTHQTYMRLYTTRSIWQKWPSIKVSKTRKPVSSLRSVDESVAKDVPEKEPRADDEEADMQRALEESLKSMYDVPRGCLRSTQSSNAQKKSHTDRYIFQRRTSIPTGSSRHDESSSLYVELRLTNSEEEFKEDVPGADAGGQGQVGPDPGNAKTSQPMPSLMVHAGSDREHMDLDVADVSIQTLPEQMDKGFAATAYPKVQENLKLTVEEQVLLEELASSSGTLSFLQHLTKDLSFGDLFFSDKPSQADNDKATAETKAESMVSVTIQQDMSSIPPMKTPIIDLTSRPKSPKRIGELEHIMANLIQENRRLEQRLDNHGAHLYTLEQLGIPHQLYKALEKSMNRNHSEELAKDLAEACKKKKKSHESPKTPPGSPPHHPPPPPPPAGPSGALGSPRAFRSSQVPPPPPPPPSTNQEEQSSDDEDIGSTHIPKVNLRQDWWKPLEEERPATPEPAWLIMSSDVPVPPNNLASALASNYSPPLEDLLLSQAGDIAMFMDWFCKRQGITELKSLDLEGSMWIEEEYKYDIVTMYGISHWWFQIQRFYIDRHTSERDCRAVRTHMWILSVVKIEVFSMYGYDYMKKIVLRRVDLNEHVIAERDYKFLYPSDFEDMHLLNLQEDFRLGIESYQTQLNLTKPRWDTTGFEYKHDYTVIDYPRFIEEALDYRVKEFKINKMNPGLNTRFWTRKDVDRSKAFMFAIQKWLKTRRIFCNLESFIGGRVRDGDYRLLKRTE